MLKPDFKLLRPYTPADAADSQPVSITRFRNNDVQLSYINARHGVGKDNPTYRAIEAAIEIHKPACVIVESNFGGAVSPLNVVRDIQAQSANTQLNEAQYAILRANEHNIPFMGGEPDSALVFKMLEFAGHTTKDILCFYLLQQIPHWKREAPLTEAEFVVRGPSYLAALAHRACCAVDTIPTLDEFKKWFKQNSHNSAQDAYLNIGDGKDDLAPFRSLNATAFQKFSAQIDEVREQHILTVIADALDRYGSVLVIYGAAHLVKQRAVLEHMLGLGENIQLNFGATKNDVCLATPVVARDDVTPRSATTYVKPKLES